MSTRKILIVWLMIALCCISFVSCASANAGSVSTVDEEERMRKEAGRAVPIPMHFVVNNRECEELDQETIQNLNLAVKSCDGLTIFGTVEGTIRTFRRPILKNKNDYDAETTVATVEDTVYVHPNPQYPNLVVAVVDGEPAIFQMGADKNSKKTTVKAYVQDLYGVDSVEKIREVRLKYCPALEAGITETVITDRAELEEFFGLIDQLSGTGTELFGIDKEDIYPLFNCELILENGFNVGVSYYQKKNSIGVAGLMFESSDALSEWITAHGDQ